MKVLTAKSGVLTKSKYPSLNKYKNFFVKGKYESWACFKEKTEKVKVKKEEPKKKSTKTSKSKDKEKAKVEYETKIVKASKYGILEYTFTANREGLYRFNTYYSTDTDCTLNNTRYIDGKKVKTKKWESFKGIKNVNSINVHLKKGKHTISLLCDNRCIWLGCLAVQINTFKADTTNKGYFTLSNFNVDKTNELGVTPADITIFNDRLITEQNNQYHTEKNTSKLLFDWRDEVNIKVENDDGEKIQIFGGYISTLSFDEDFMELTLNCADRLVDCEHKYCFTELTFMRGDTDTSEYKEDYKRNFNRHGQVLNYLTKSADIPIQNNVNAKTGLIAGESYKDGFHFEYLYGKKYKKKSIAYKCKADKIKVGEDSSYGKTKTPYMELRNHYTDEQSIELFNSKWYPTQEAKGYEITEFPTFYIEYGLGDKKKEYQVVNDATSEIGNMNGNYKQKATALVSGKVTITDKAKAIFNYLDKQLTYQLYSCSHYHDVDKALKDSSLNCMDSAFVAVEMLRAVGIEAGYVHGNHTFPDGTWPHWWTYFVTAHGHKVWFDVGRTNAKWDCKGSYSGTLTKERTC